MPDPGLIQVIFPEAVHAALAAWLHDNYRGATLAPLTLENDLPTFVFRPGDAGAHEGRSAPHYEAGSGIRPPTKNGKVRGVAYEVVTGGGMELWSCDHNHAPGVRDVRNMTPSQRESAEACAETWLRQQIAEDGLHPMPVLRMER